MADFVAHHLFGKQAAEVFPQPAQRLITQRPACYFWGCQGPDPLFYRKILLGSPLHKTGNRMHSEKTDELFFALSRGVKCLSGDARDIAGAYFYGFLCHYALDSEIHPYVYCRQEQIRSADEKLSASAVHCQIESDIDSELYLREYGVPVTEFEPGAHYTLSLEEKAVLSALLRMVLLTVYGEDVPTRDLRRSFEEMLAWEEFLYSDSRMVYYGAQKLERLYGRGALLTGHMNVERPEWDCMNEGHDPWNNLWTPGETRTESVRELLGLARIRAAALAGQYAAQFGSDMFLKQHFDTAFDNGSPKRLVMPR